VSAILSIWVDSILGKHLGTNNEAMGQHFRTRQQMSVVVKDKTLLNELESMINTQLQNPSLALSKMPIAFQPQPGK